MDEPTDLDFLLLQARAQVDVFGDATVAQLLDAIGTWKVKDLFHAFLDGIEKA